MQKMNREQNGIRFLFSHLVYLNQWEVYFEGQHVET